MPSITQTIPTYNGGISEQADQSKFPGQVRNIINAIPDVTYGLYKRPGSKRVGSSPLANVQSNGSWFHYYRDETEGSYIGQIAADGQIRLWSCTDGTQKNVYYHTETGSLSNNTNYDSTNSNHTAIKAYLTPSSATSTEDLQALTINDTTFINNRTKTVATTGTTPAATDTHYAYVELIRTENGRQYALNAYSSNTTTSLTRATRVKIISDNLAEGSGTGDCPGVGTQVFYANTTVEHTIPASAVDVSTEVITKANHGWANGTKIRYMNAGGTSITGLTHKEVYYVIDSATDTFKVSATSGGSAVNLTGTGNDNQYFTQLTDDVLSITNSTDARYTGVGTRDNLIFRLTTLGQQGKTGGGTSHTDYSCSYNREVQLLHGGENWVLGDRVTVHMDTAKSTYEYTVEVTETETAEVKGTINGGVNGIIRPTPTPFDADTAVTVDTILGGLQDGFAGTGITSTVIGNGLYLTSSSAFNIEVVDQDIMRVMQDTANDVTKLPLQCKLGYIVKIQNTRSADEDDYYVKFSSANGLDGSGAWIECAKPGIPLSFDASTMPHTLTRLASGNFLIKQGVYTDRIVGDEVTNPVPTFVGQKINKIVFFRNRICFLSGENVICSRPGELSIPAFWSWTALAVSAIDPIDIAAASTYPSELFDAAELNVGLVVFSTNQQFLLVSDAETLNPDTAKMKKLAIYNYNETIPPVVFGTTIGFLDSSGKYSRFAELWNVQREGEPDLVETSKVVPTLIPKNIDMVTNSRENGMVLFGKTGQKEIQGYRYYQIAEKRGLSSWFKWEFNNALKYHFIVNDTYFYLDSDNFLQTIELIQTDTDLSIDQDNVNYQIHIDNYTTVANGTYNSDTNTTLFNNQSDWIDEVTASDNKLVLVDTDSNTAREGRYAECTVTNVDSFTVPGDWSGATLNIGYLYDYQVDFPRIYVTKQAQEDKVDSDINSSLTVHRIKLNFGKIGLYETTLTRVGKDNYTEVYESTILDEYNVSDSPYLDEHIQAVPVYENNRNVDISLKSTHPSPAILRGMSWEGDYSPKYYKRV